MKNILQVCLLFVFLLGASGMLLAQPGGNRPDPKQRAERTTQMMADSLGLSEAQVAKVSEINLKYAEKAQATRSEASEDREARRAAMSAMREEQDTEIKAIMTQEQWDKWQTVRRNARQNWSNREQSGDAPPASGQGKRKNKNKKN